MRPTFPTVAPVLAFNRRRDAWRSRVQTRLTEAYLNEKLSNLLRLGFTLDETGRLHAPR